MNTTPQIPSSEEVRRRLCALGRGQLVKLAHVSNIPFPTLVKIKTGETKNPGIETVRQFLPHLDIIDKATS